jgi:acyl dehydratase
MQTYLTSLAATGRTFHVINVDGTTQEISLGQVIAHGWFTNLLIR